MDLICEQNMVFDTIENPILRPNSPYQKFVDTPVDYI